jgi:hypothetical protein
MIVWKNKALVNCQLKYGSECIHVAKSLISLASIYILSRQDTLKAYTSTHLMKGSRLQERAVFVSCMSAWEGKHYFLVLLVE